MKRRRTGAEKAKRQAKRRDSLEHSSVAVVSFFPFLFRSLSFHLVFAVTLMLGTPPRLFFLMNSRDLVEPLVRFKGVRVARTSGLLPPCHRIGFHHVWRMLAFLQ